MDDILYIVSNVVSIALLGVQLAMTVRAVLSWLPLEPNGFTEFIYAVTEPFIYPFRALFSALGIFQNFPLDLSFTAAYIVIGILIFLL